MSEKTIVWLLAGVLVLLYLVTTWSENAIFNTGNHKFVPAIEQVISYSKAQQWSQAEQEVSKVQKIWDKGNPWIAIKYAEVDFTFLAIYLEHLKSAVKNRDLHNVVRDGKVAIMIFKNITAIAPKP